MPATRGVDSGVLDDADVPGLVPDVPALAPRVVVARHGAVDRVGVDAQAVERARRDDLERTGGAAPAPAQEAVAGVGCSPAVVPRLRRSGSRTDEGGEDGEEGHGDRDGAALQAGLHVLHVVPFGSSSFNL